MDIDLKGKRAIVCGSTQGMGRACAVEFAQLGASVTLIARNEERLRRVRDELSSSAGQSHSYIVADFFQHEDLRKKIETYTRNNPPIHILVNNTGGPKGGLLIDATLDEFTNAFAAHLLCNHILAQAVVPGMKLEGYGRIINIISTSVKQPISGLGVSNTIRGAVAAWSKTMAGELGPFGITVNNVLPGMTRTLRSSSLIEAKAGKTGRLSEEIEAEMIAEIPVGRAAEPSEFANAVAFLASPAAAYINGINLPVDGGRTLSL